MNTLIPKGLNYTVGTVLLLMGLYCFMFPDAFMGAYDILLSTPQSRTEIRTLSGFSSIIGVLFLRFTHIGKDQKKILFASLSVTGYFVVARLIGLILDGWEQHGTYLELGFETIALGVVGSVYLKYSTSNLD